MIHETAIISPNAKLAEDVAVGPYTIIGDNVEIDSGTVIGSNVVIKGPTHIGPKNKIFQFASIGDDPQDKKYQGESDSALEIGEANVIREYCMINRGTSLGGGRTVIGHNNWIMAYVHIAHDCLVGDHTVFSNLVTLAGHVKVDNYVVLGGFVGVHQFCHIGAYSFAAGSTTLTKDVPPFLTVYGHNKIGGLNREGLKRGAFSDDVISQIKQAYKIIYRSQLSLSDALENLAPLAKQHAEVQEFSEFIINSKRSIVR